MAQWQQGSTTQAHCRIVLRAYRKAGNIRHVLTQFLSLTRVRQEEAAHAVQAAAGRHAGVRVRVADAAVRDVGAAEDAQDHLACRRVCMWMDDCEQLPRKVELFVTEASNVRVVAEEAHLASIDSNNRQKQPTAAAQRVKTIAQPMTHRPAPVLGTPSTGGRPQSRGCRQSGQEPSAGRRRRRGSRRGR